MSEKYHVIVAKTKKDSTTYEDIYEMIEQGENIYTYLVNADTVVIFEMPRIDQSIIHDRTTKEPRVTMG